MRTVAYMLRLMPKFACNRTKIGSITDPAELEVAHRKLFPLLQDESIYLESKSLQKSPTISETSTLLNLYPFIGPNGLLRAIGRTQMLEIATFGTKHLVILDAQNQFSPFVPEASTRKTLPPRCRVFEGSDPTDLVDSET